MATVSDEFGQAANIKSKRTRKHVRAALKSLRSHLRYYDAVPENGLALFSGAVEQPGGKTDVKTVVLDSMPTPVAAFRYRCGATFDTGPLESMLDVGPRYGLLLLDKRDAHIGSVRGSSVTHHGHISSLVPGKHKAGGQSQQRFARLRLDAVNEFYKKVARLVEHEFVETRHNLQGILVGGPGPSKDEFLDGGYLHHELDELVVGVLDIGDTTERGLDELVERGAPVLEDANVTRQRDLLTRFFEDLRHDEPVAYGREDVHRATEFGAVETLLLGADVSDNALIELVEEYGGSVERIEDGFEKGQQFHQAFGGIGARLRFPVQ
jgi:peptide chain release factor subunit 1